MLHYMEQSNYPKTTKTYYCMFLCMRETLELEHALDTIDIMKRDNIKMNLHSYATVIDMAVHLNEVEIAHQLLKEAEKLNEFGQQAGILYTSVLQLAAFNGHYTIVKDIWKKASKYKTDEGNLLYILDLAGKHGDTKIATEVIRIIGERGYTYRECHFAPLIDTFAATGDITNTFQLFHVMRKVGITPNKKTALPLAYRLGQDKNAIFKAKHILEKQSPVDVTAFNLVIHALAYNKEIDAALSLYQKSKELQVTPNSETLDAVLDACIHCKDAGLGKDVYEELLAKGVQPTSTSLSKMVTLMCTQEDYEEAFMYLEEMKKRDMVPLRGCYYKLVKVLASARDARLEMALDDMKAYGYSISTHISQFIENEKTTATL
ncbi:uncharacterized protein B0P05DRAFT_539621, partial [Gilbertella persicaria]|uniref:uncharacterized protein n=1 Tax=Gilbertella persicaria TaxID=101096 RepID=UPI00221E55EF